MDLRVLAVVTALCAACAPTPPANEFCSPGDAGTPPTGSVRFTRASGTVDVAGPFACNEAFYCTQASGPAFVSLDIRDGGVAAVIASPSATDSRYEGGRVTGLSVTAAFSGPATPGQARTLTVGGSYCAGFGNAALGPSTVTFNGVAFTTAAGQ